MINPIQFCAAPFKELVIDSDGRLLPCCDFKQPAPTYRSVNTFATFDTWWDEELIPLRQDMLTNQLNSGCKSCKSKPWPTPAGPKHTHINNKYRNLFTDGKFLDDGIIESIEIRFGNYCNLKCIMCGPYASSSLAEEYTRHTATFLKNNFNTPVDRIKTTRWWDEPGALDKLFDVVKNAKYVHFTGGEPMMIPEVVDILNHLDSNVVVGFNTNMTKFSDKIYNTLAKFQRVVVHASVEGINEHNDYVRYNSQWGVIDTAIKKLQTFNNVNITLVHVLQHTSIFALPNLLEYGQQNNLIILPDVVYDSGYGGGGYLTIDSVSPTDVDNFKKYLTANLNPVIEAWVNTYSFNLDKHRRYQEYVNMLDGIRSTNFNATFNPTWI